MMSMMGLMVTMFMLVMTVQDVVGMEYHADDTGDGGGGGDDHGTEDDDFT